MKPSQLMFALSAIYIAPHVSREVAICACVACLVSAVICTAVEIYIGKRYEP